MLVGSGGVVALVVSAWGVLWALRRVPGRDWRAWAPAAVALLALLIALPAWSVFTTASTGVTTWTASAPSEAAAVLLDLTRQVLRPLRASVMGLLAVGATIAVVRRRHPAEDAAELHGLETLGVGVLAPLSLAVLGAALWMSSRVSGLASGAVTPAEALSAARLGLGLAILTAVLAAGLWAFTTLRAR